MRLDYSLYGFAIVFFIVTAASFAFIAEQDGKSLWAVSTFILGVLSVGAGYFLKPKIQKAPAVSASAIAPDVPSKSSPQATATVETPVVESPAVIETPQVEAPQVETNTSGEVGSEAPITTSISVNSIADTAAPNVEVLPTSTISTIVALELTQVKGIGEKRAIQLKTVGVNSVEDLAKSDAADLAVKLKVSAKFVKKWVAGAKELIK